MSKIADEMYSFLTEGYTEEDILKHYGKGHEDGGHSGRYPWALATILTSILLTCLIKSASFGKKVRLQKK